MPDKKISQLPLIISIADSDLFAIVNSGVTNKVTATTLRSYMGNSFILSTGDTMTGDLLFEDGFGIDSETLGDTLNIGETNASIINIGRPGATVNIIGNVLSEQVTNSFVTDKLITLNDGGAAASGSGVGFEIEEDGSITGYIKTNAARTGFSFKSPANAGILDIITLGTDVTLTAGNSGTIAVLTDITGSGSFSNGGNSFAAPAILGTNDLNTLSFETNNITALTIDTSQNILVKDAVAQHKFNVSGTQGLPTTATDGIFSIQAQSTTTSSLRFGVLPSNGGWIQAGATNSASPQDIKIQPMGGRLMFGIQTQVHNAGFDVDITTTDATQYGAYFKSNQSYAFHIEHAASSSASSEKYGFNIEVTGAGGSVTSMHAIRGVNTSGAVTNIGGYFSATGATTNNYAAIFLNGLVGMGLTDPTAKLTVKGTGSDPNTINSLFKNSADTELLKILDDGQSMFTCSTASASTLTATSFGTSSVAGDFITDLSNSTSLREVIRLQRKTSGTPTNNYGGFFAFYIEDSAGNSEPGAYIAWVGVNVTDGAEVTDLRLYTRSGGTSPTEKFRISGAGDVSIGNNIPPLAKFHVFQATLGSEVFRLESSSTNDDPRESVFQNRVATTDTTLTTLNTFAIPTDTTVRLKSVIIARRTGGASGTNGDSASYELSATYKNIGGTVTLVGIVTTITDEDVAGYNAAYNISGTNVLLQVTGVATTNITWHLPRGSFMPLST